MSFVASASGVIHAERTDCFARLRDFSTWRDWMPLSFRPVRGPERDLEVGDRLFIRIAPTKHAVPLLITAKIVRVTPGREITWRGGVPGLLVGEHAFLFEDAEGEPGSTLVRSEETWSGALASVNFAAKMIGASASLIGRHQIDCLAAALEKRG
jgi:hypothetical protein